MTPLQLSAVGVRPSRNWPPHGFAGRVLAAAGVTVVLVAAAARLALRRFMASHAHDI